MAWGAWLRGDQARWGIGIIALLFVILAAVPLALTGAGLLGGQNAPPASASAVVTPAAKSAPTEPPATPVGTPAPKPTEAVDTAASASVSPPPAPARATPTASPQPGLWRVEGYVVDESGAALKNVCVVVGPRGCQRWSPHTDERGHYFLDVASTVDPPTVFDFYFELPGRQTIWWRFMPTGPIEFNVVLRRT